MLGFNFKGLATPHGAFKLFELSLVIVTFLLGRCGKDKDYENPSFGEYLDHPWLGQGTTVAWLIIVPATIFGILLGDEIAWRTDALLSLAGAFLYIATGSVTIDHNLDKEGNTYSIAMALGSFAIITGIFMLLDAAVMVFRFARKQK